MIQIQYFISAARHHNHLAQNARFDGDTLMYDLHKRLRNTMMRNVRNLKHSGVIK